MAYSIMCKKLFVRIFAFILVMLERILGTFFFGPPYMMPKCMSCHKAIVVITGRAHCFYDDTYMMLVLFLWDLSSLCVVDHLWPRLHGYPCVLVWKLKTYFEPKEDKDAKTMMVVWKNYRYRSLAAKQ